MAKQKKSVLLDYLHRAFEEMDDRQRRNVFADAVPGPKNAAVDGDRLAEELDQFRRNSLARKYYAPFMVDSKNYRHVPEETREWCDRFAGFVRDALWLSERGKYAQAVRCFAVLSELIRAVDEGQEIIFAEEAGSWMIPADKRVWLKAHLTSLAATADADEFAAAVLPILEWDSWNSFSGEVYVSALRVANPEQAARLRAEAERRRIRVGPVPLGDSSEPRSLSPGHGSEASETTNGK
jgi:hypothetical protein